MRPLSFAERLPIVGVVLFGLLSSLCCVVTFALVALGVTGPWLAGLQIFEPYRVPLDVSSAAALALAWCSHVVATRSCRPDGACTAPSTLRQTRAALTLATLAVGGVTAAPYLIAYFGGS